MEYKTVKNSEGKDIKLHQVSNISKEEFEKYNTLRREAIKNGQDLSKLEKPKLNEIERQCTSCGTEFFGRICPVCGKCATCG